MTNEINHPVYSHDGKPVAFSAATLEKVHGLIARYPGGQQKSALLPLLHIAQEELGGHLTPGIMDYVASLLQIQPIEVYEVATFYSMFNLDKVGEYVIEVCRTGPCSIAGGEEVREKLQELLGVKPGETTPDGLFTLKEVECLGACGNGPAMQVNTNFYEHLTVKKIEQIIEDLKAGKGTPGAASWEEQFC